MKGICHIWSTGRHFSPSLPGNRYLKLSSQKRPPGRNLGEHRLVRSSGTTSRGTALLAFLERMRRFLRADQGNTTNRSLFAPDSSTHGGFQFVDENLFEVIAVLRYYKTLRIVLSNHSFCCGSTTNCQCVYQYFYFLKYWFTCGFILLNSQVYCGEHEARLS